MDNIGIVIETAENKVKAANFGVITAARGEGGHKIYALVLNAGADALKDDLQAYGVQTIVEISFDGVGRVSNPGLKARALVEAMKKYEIRALFGLSSAIGRDLLARIAAFLEAPLALDCVDVNLNENIVTKSHFGGKAFARIKFLSDCFICGIRPNAIEASVEPCDAEVTRYHAPVKDFGGLVVRKVKQGKAGRVDLTEANIIITGGRPIGSAKNYEILKECADILGAEVGASRAAVDAGYAPYSMQIGQTGKTVSPKLYLACGLSGSIQHFAGMKTSKVIVAVNTDKDAPIFNKCDYGIVGDLFDVVPVLTDVLRESKGTGALKMEDEKYA